MRFPLEFVYIPVVDIIHIFVTDPTVSNPFGLVHIANLSVDIFFSC